MEINVIAINGSDFGSVVHAEESQDEFYQQVFTCPRLLPDLLDQANGLLIIKDFSDIAEQPERLVALGQLFGKEVENYRRPPMMWRSSVLGPPGPEYDGESKSRISDDNTGFLQGLGDRRCENLTRTKYAN